MDVVPRPAANDRVMVVFTTLLSVVGFAVISKVAFVFVVSGKPFDGGTFTIGFAALAPARTALKKVLKSSEDDREDPAPPPRRVSHPVRPAPGPTPRPRPRPRPKPRAEDDGA